MTDKRAPDPAGPPPRDASILLLIVGGTFGLQALTLVTGVISARMLGAEGRGEVALVFAIGLVTSQLSLGGSPPVAIAKNLAERHLAARDGLRRVARRWGWLVLLPAVVAAAVMVVAHDTGPVVGLSVAAAVMALQTVLFRLLVGGLQGETRHLGRMAVVGLVPQSIFAVVLTTAFVAGWDWSALDVLAAFFVSCALGIAVGFRALARPTRRPDDELDGTELWRETRRTYVSSVRPLDSLGLAQLLVGGLLGTVSLGLYAAATAVASLCSFVGNGISVIVLPRVAQNRDDPLAQRAVVRRWVLLAVVMIAMIVTALEIVVEPVIRLAFGEEFVAAVEVARWLILADGLMALRRVLISVLQGQGRGGTASWVELALTPVIVVGIAISATASSLPGIGITLVVVGALACVVLGLLVARTPARADGQPVSPPSITST